MITTNSKTALVKFLTTSIALNEIWSDEYWKDTLLNENLLAENFPFYKSMDETVTDIFEWVKIFGIDRAENLNLQQDLKTALKTFNTAANFLQENWNAELQNGYPLEKEFWIIQPEINKWVTTHLPKL